jgi:protein gp37
MGQSKYKGTTRISGGRPKWNGKIRLDEETLNIPRSWKAGRMIFVNSMSDLFHEDVPLEFISRVFEVMEVTPHHTFQILTKRADRLAEFAGLLTWPRNVWMGVSVESAEYFWRIERLRETKAVIKFLSLEPLLGLMDGVDLRNIDWVIVGGESGPGARAMQADWVRSIRDQCTAAEVAFHFKQWGGVNKKAAGRTLDGRTWDELPSVRDARSAASILARAARRS